MTSSAQLIATLRELIEAIDERVPHVERAGEAQISRDASALRRMAVQRVEELTRAGFAMADGSCRPPLRNAATSAATSACSP